MAVARVRARGRAAIGAALAILAGMAVGCGEGEGPAPVEDAAPEEHPTPDEHPAPEEARSTVEVQLRDALEELVRGPSPEDVAAGLHSWFSDETAHVVRSVRVDEEGLAVVDFRDLQPLIPGASSSAGSEALLDELNTAVFAVPGVEAVEYRMEGSCSRFWEWLQYACQVVNRPGAGP
jgi:spore germination protein GerM